MDRQNIDRLFREKLDQLEVTPSNHAWSQVEKQIRPKKTPVIYWVAASVSLLFISWIVWPDTTQQEFTPIASEVSSPEYQELPEFVMPAIDKAEDDEKVEAEVAPRKIQKKQKVQTQFAVNKPEDKKAEAIKDEMPILENIDTKTMVAEIETEEPEVLESPIEEQEKSSFRAVKITYIASSASNNAPEVQKTDSTGVLKKFIAFTEKIDPGDMLADIKTAKDNLLNSGFKSKKDRNSL